MRKLPVLFALLLTTSIHADSLLRVKSVNPTTWIHHSEYTIKGGSAGTRGGVGAAAGWWLLGPIGAVAGAAISANSTPPDQVVQKDEVISGYLDVLSNGTSVRTRRLLKVGDVFDSSLAE